MIRVSQAGTPSSLSQREPLPSPVPFALPASPSPALSPELVGAMAEMTLSPAQEKVHFLS